MFKTRMLARLVIPVLVATAFPMLVAGESTGTPPASNSIHEWKSKPTATPAADAAAPQAKSIHEWKSKPSATSTTKAPIAPAAKPAAKSAVSAAVPKSPVTISFTSTLRQGNLVVMLDDVPIFNEKFQKPVLLISQTTTWDPLQVAAGKHRLAAKVYGSRKTYLSAIYDLDVSRTKASTLRFVMHGDKLTVELAS